MAHRDNHQAALLRAEALERELAETKEALAEKERALAEREADDAKREVARAVRVEETRATTETQATSRTQDDAEASLDELRRRAADAAIELKGDPVKRARAMHKDDGQREARRRILRSASAAGGLADPYLFIAALPIFGMTTFVMALTTMPMQWCFSIAGVVVATLFFFAYVYAPIRAKQLPGWLASLPYAVPGYLGLLARKAPTKDECSLLVTLEFAGAPPEDLLTLLRGVDPTLQPNGDGFLRAFPISIQRSKHGTPVGEPRHESTASPLVPAAREERASPGACASPDLRG
ncbi:MAG: hypothetical protein AB8H86_31500 [Polyangiales bacterium]